MNNMPQRSVGATSFPSEACKSWTKLRIVQWFSSLLHPHFTANPLETHILKLKLCISVITVGCFSPYPNHSSSSSFIIQNYSLSSSAAAVIFNSHTFTQSFLENSFQKGVQHHQNQQQLDGQFSPSRAASHLLMCRKGSKVVQVELSCCTSEAWSNFFLQETCGEKILVEMEVFVYVKSCGCFFSIFKSCNKNTEHCVDDMEWYVGKL